MKRNLIACLLIGCSAKEPTFDSSKAVFRIKTETALPSDKPETATDQQGITRAILICRDKEKHTVEFYSGISKPEQTSYVGAIIGGVLDLGIVRALVDFFRDEER